MAHLKSVTRIGENRWHWVARGPAGSSVEWDAEIVAHRPNDFISWRSLEGSDVDHAGIVRFEPARGGRGTVVRVEIEYAPPAGALGVVVAKLFGEAPQKQIAVDLRRFKQLMETGEVLKTEGQPSGRPGNRRIAGHLTRRLKIVVLALTQLENQFNYCHSEPASAAEESASWISSTLSLRRLRQMRCNHLPALRPLLKHRRHSQAAGLFGIIIDDIPNQHRRVSIHAHRTLVQ